MNHTSRYRSLSSLLRGMMLCSLIGGCATDAGFDFDETDGAMASDTKGDGSTNASVVMGSLSKDRPVDGRFLAAGKFAAYTFEKKAGVVVRVSVDARASGDDSVLAIYGPRTASGWGHRIAESDDAPGHGTDSIVANLTLPTTGKYVAIVGEASKRAGGAFEVLLETNEDDLDASAPDDAVTGAMVRIPAGEFLFGCNAAIDSQCRELHTGEAPLTTRSLPEIEIDVREVTVGAYDRCVKAGVCSLPHWNFNRPYPYPGSPEAYASYPVFGVLLAQAETFCAWAGKRLPNEDEWEKAMRGTDGRIYPWGNRDFDCTLANWSGTCGTLPQAVGTHPTGKSPYGVQDGIGNVSEITYSVSTNQVAIVRGVRNAGTTTGYGYQRVSARFAYGSESQVSQNGFRCARTPVD